MLRQGLDALKQVERGLRAQRRAEVTQLLGTQLGGGSRTRQKLPHQDTPL